MARPGESISQNNGEFESETPTADSEAQTRSCPHNSGFAICKLIVCLDSIVLLQSTDLQDWTLDSPTTYWTLVIKRGYSILLLQLVITRQAGLVALQQFCKNK